MDEYEYVPKGSMCINCQDIGQACNYRFRDMQVLTRHHFIDGSRPLALVKCTYYKPKEKNEAK